MNSTDKSGLATLKKTPFDYFLELLDQHTKNWHKDGQNREKHIFNLFNQWKIKYNHRLEIRSEIINKENKWALLIIDNNINLINLPSFVDILFEDCEFDSFLRLNNVKCKFYNNTFNGSVKIDGCEFNKNVIFQKNTFNNTLEISASTFKYEFILERNIFNDDVKIDKCQFNAKFNFQENTFNKPVKIDKCEFNDNSILFDKDYFKEDSQFFKCKFKYSKFNRLIFKKDVSFLGSTFDELAEFNQVKFFNQADFQDVTFKSDVNFTTLNQTAHCATKLCESLPESYNDDSLIPTYIKKITEKYKVKEIKDNKIICDQETFEINDSKSKYTLIYKCETKLIFLNTLFEGRTAFHDSENIKFTYLNLAQFKNSFSYSTYNENLVDFSKAFFEKIPQIKIPSHWKDSTEANEDAFRFIKNLFKNDNNFEQEAIYFKKEMDSKYKKLTWRSDPIHKSFFLLFKKCSDYGYSYIRPLLCLGGITLACYSFALFKDPTTHQFNSKLIYDMLNTMFPFLKLNISEKEPLYRIVIKLLFSYPLLFLTLLGFRNKFKLK